MSYTGVNSFQQLYERINRTYGESLDPKIVVFITLALLRKEWLPAQLPESRELLEDLYRNTSRFLAYADQFVDEFRSIQAYRSLPIRFQQTSSTSPPREPDLLNRWMEGSLSKLPPNIEILFGYLNLDEIEFARLVTDSIALLEPCPPTESPIAEHLRWQSPLVDIVERLARVVRDLHLQIFEKLTACPDGLSLSLLSPDALTTQAKTA